MGRTNPVKPGGRGANAQKRQRTVEDDAEEGAMATQTTVEDPPQGMPPHNSVAAQFAAHAAAGFGIATPLVAGTTTTTVLRCPWNWHSAEMLAALGAFFEARERKQSSTAAERTLWAAQAYANWASAIKKAGLWTEEIDFNRSVYYRTASSATLVNKATELKAAVVNVVIPAVVKKWEVPSGRQWEGDYDVELKGVYDAYLAATKPKGPAGLHATAWTAWCFFGPYGRTEYAGKVEFRVPAITPRDMPNAPPQTAAGRAQQRRNAFENAKKEGPRESDREDAMARAMAQAAVLRAAASNKARRSQEQDALRELYVSAYKKGDIDLAAAVELVKGTHTYSPLKPDAPGDQPDEQPDKQSGDQPDEQSDKQSDEQQPGQGADGVEELE